MWAGPRRRAACIYDGWCHVGCPIGALANPQWIYLREAFAHGATLLNDARVTRVLTTTDGRRATGVEYVDLTGTTQVQNADLIVLAWKGRWDAPHAPTLKAVLQGASCPILVTRIVAPDPQA